MPPQAVRARILSLGDKTERPTARDCRTSKTCLRHDLDRREESGMRREILIPSLLLSMLCASVDDNRYLLTTHDNLVPAIETPRSGELHYTRHAAAPVRAEIISLRING